MNTPIDLACDSIQRSHGSRSTRTSQSSLNSRTYLLPSSISSKTKNDSAHHDTPIDSWLADLEFKLSSNTIYEEHDSIPHSRFLGANEDGRQLENTRRNRYTDVIPYDDARVHLLPTKENPNGYINASHVKFGIENTIYSYIATEFPLPITLTDFWRMIFDYNVHVIVMLIGSDEMQLYTDYFPTTKYEKCQTDEYEIRLLSEQNQEHFSIRQLRMKGRHKHQIRTIIHLQYTTWTNKQLPLNTTSFINFINIADTFRRHYGETNPCLVHCTAGIGRTGIFILIHIMIQCITFNKKISVANVLKVLREYRMSFVDRTYSYIFVYHCLIDYLKSSRLI